MNGLPVARPDAWYSTPLNTALTVGAQNQPLLENDEDPEGSSLTLTVVSNPANGSLSNVSSSAGTFTYTPNTGYSGIDTFTYKVNDGTADGNTVTASIAVGGHFGPRTNTNEPNMVGQGCRPSHEENPGVTLMDINASCLTGGLTYSQALTPSTRLLYNSMTIPRPIVVLETFLMSSSNVPDEIKAQLTFNGTAGTEYSYSTSGLQAGQALRFALQADGTSLSTGRYAYNITLTARFGSTSVTRTYGGNYELVNRSASTHEFGLGWQLASVDKLVSATGGMMLVRSSGEALWFADNGSGGYHKASGDVTFSTLVKNGDNTYTLTTKHGDKSNFSSTGLLNSRVDRNSNTVTYTYSNGLLTQITDPFSRNTTLSYTSGRLTSITDTGSRTATLAYDANGRLTSVTQPDPDTTGPLSSPVWSFSYDATTHQLTQLSDPLNRSTSFAYGSGHKRLTTATHPDSFTWQIVGLQTIGIPASSSGNSLVAANPLGTFTNERSHSSTFRTDAFGGLTEWNNPLGHKSTIARNVDGLVTKTTDADPDGAGSKTSPVTIVGYDSLGNTTFQRNPDNSTRTWTYNSNFNLTASFTDELGRVNSYGYDSLGNMTSSVDPAGYTTSYTYTSRGLVASQTKPDPDGAGPLSAAVMSYAYDSYGRLTTLTNPDSSTRSYTYDSADNRLTETDELNHTTSVAYDKLGRVTSITDRVNATTSFTYNALGLLTKQTDALGNATDREYSNRNFLTKTLQPDPDGAGSLGRPESSLSYDEAGNLVYLGEPSYFGMPKTHTYDSANRRTLTRQTISGTNIDTSYTYDNLGRVIKVTDALSHETEFEYNSRGWRIKTTGQDPDGYYGPATRPVSEVGYDAAGQRISETDPLGFVTSYTYNSRGLKASVTLPDPVSVAKVIDGKSGISERLRCGSQKNSPQRA